MCVLCISKFYKIFQINEYEWGSATHTFADYLFDHGYKGFHRIFKYIFFLFLIYGFSWAEEKA